MNTRDEHLVKTKAELVKNLDIYLDGSRTSGLT